MKGAYKFSDRTLIARFIGLEKRPAVVKLSSELLRMVSAVDLNGWQRGRGLRHCDTGRYGEDEWPHSFVH